MNQHTSSFALSVLLVIFPVGCGIIGVERTLFSAQPTDSEGQPVFFEDLEDIAADPSLLPEDIADELRGLGIESENFINAVVEDGLGAISTPPVTDTGDGDGDGDTETDGGA